jgi:DNA-binding PadR family transcriptional regulator
VTPRLKQTPSLSLKSRVSFRPLWLTRFLIGLVCLSPASGCDLKRIFAATPMGIYQPSSGSLYPALRRLEAKGLVKAAEGAGESARHRRVYEPIQAGQAAHAAWLRTPWRCPRSHGTWGCTSCAS